MARFKLQVFSTTVITILTSSCKVDFTDGDAFTGGFSQKKLSSKSASIDGTPKENKTVAKGRYLVRVSLNEIPDNDERVATSIESFKQVSAGSLCVGRLFLHIKEDFAIEFPDSKIKCPLIGELDLEKILSGLNDDADREKAAAAEDKMLRLKKLGPMEFNPPRPLLVGPIIQDPTLYRNLTETKTYSVRYTDKDAGGAVTEDSGSITVNVLDVGATFEPMFNSMPTFDSMVRFEMLASGFEKVPRTKGFLFDRVEFTINSRPLNIIGIKMQSKAADLMSAAPKPPGAKGPSFIETLAKVFGSSLPPVYIRLDATTFETY